MFRRFRILACAMGGIAACGGFDDGVMAQNASFDTTQVANFSEPWAMTFLPDGRLLVTEKAGALRTSGRREATAHQQTENQRVPIG
jgi:glucose/arabinose dehydrogenase